MFDVLEARVGVKDLKKLTTSFMNDALPVFHKGVLYL